MKRQTDNVQAEPLDTRRVGTYEMRRIRRRRFAERAPLSGDEFFDTFYRDSGLDRATVVAVRRVVAHAAELPEDVLRPSDRFDHELSAAEGWETWWDDGVLEMKQRGSVSVAEKTRSVDWGMVTTLDDLVRQVAGANRDLS